MQQHMAEPEPFAWLNQPQNTEDGCKVLTQFKTVESDDSSSSDPNVHQEVDDVLCVVDVYPPCVIVKSALVPPRRVASSSGKALSLKDVSGTPPLSPCIVVPEDLKVLEKEHHHRRSSLATAAASEAVVLPTSDKGQKHHDGPSEGQLSESTKTRLLLALKSTDAR
jgi:hypothetical protein